MEALIKGLKRPFTLNGQEVSDASSILATLTDGAQITVHLKPVSNAHDFELQVESTQTGRFTPGQSSTMEVDKTYVFKVRQYMTKPASPEFDFMAQQNGNIPMPFRTMQGTVVKETRGMYFMNCKVVPMKTDTCMRCGRRLTHPVSRLYGVGPECGGHAHINPFETEQELHAALDSLKQQLANITWSGWVIKSAIEEFEEVT